MQDHRQADAPWEHQEVQTLEDSNGEQDLERREPW